MVEELNGQEEAAEIQALQQARSSGTEQAPQPGETWFLVSSKWLAVWTRYIEGSGVRPPPIDNSDLLAHAPDPDQPSEQLPARVENTLRDDIQEGQDFQLHCEPVWEMFSSWYGGGPELPRKVVSKGKHVLVEINQLFFQIVKHISDGDVLDGDTPHPRLYGISCTATLADLKNTLRSEFSNLPVDMAVYAVIDNRSDPEPLAPDSATLSDLGLFRGQSLLIKKDESIVANGHAAAVSDPDCPQFPEAVANGEQKSSENLKGTPGDGPNGAATFRFEPVPSSTTEDYPRYSTPPPRDLPTSPIPIATLGPRAGIVGLNNLGNTCFLNSAVQCLSNTKELTECFLTNEFEKDLNENNPIGTNGVLAREYNCVLRNLWSGNSASFAPRSFKQDISTFAPQFSGYAQQDAQELLAFLLDGIHEDLNRVKIKPYVEAVEPSGRPDHEVADDAWNAHKRRHDSKIVDLFQGQYKSTVICPDCEKVSVTFDPFMYLTLPLPAKRFISVAFFLFRLSSISDKPVKHCVSILKTANFGDFRAQVAKETGIPVEKLIVVDCLINKVYALDDEKSLDFSNYSDLLVYEVEDDITGRHFATSSNDTVVAEIHHRHSRNCASVAVPFLVTMKRIGVTGVQLSALIRTRSKRFIDFERNEHGPSTGPEAPEDIQQLQSVTMKTNTASPEITIDLCSAKAIEIPETAKHVTIYVEQEAELVDSAEASLKGSYAVAESVSAPMPECHGRSLSLTKCLDLWGEEETLSEENAWFCPQCKAHKQATKRLRLWRTPDILVVHLKRFSYTAISRNKLETLVDFPLVDFDLEDFIDGPPTSPGPSYDLFAISNHFGGLGGGHYTAYAKSPWKEEREGSSGWYNFDDSCVTQVEDPSSIQSSSAYLLFYRRRTT